MMRRVANAGKSVVTKRQNWEGCGHLVMGAGANPSDRPSWPGGVARSAGVVVQAQYFSTLNNHPVRDFRRMLRDIS
jgi:hypothetical protein